MPALFLTRHPLKPRLDAQSNRSATMGGGRVIEVATKAEWDAQLAAAGDKAVIIDFSAVWCGPCQMIGPVFVQLSEQFPGLVFLKVDVDTNAVGGVSRVWRICVLAAVGWRRRRAS
jgi:thiol-disulfide isomerase/thioredoxin